MLDKNFACCEDTRPLRLASKLADLRVGNANPAHFVRCDENPLLRYQKRRDTTSGVSSFLAAE
jgi:hypothetical protein